MVTLLYVQVWMIGHWVDIETLSQWTLRSDWSWISLVGLGLIMYFCWSTFKAISLNIHVWYMSPRKENLSASLTVIWDFWSLTCKYSTVPQCIYSFTWDCVVLGKACPLSELQFSPLCIGEEVCYSNSEREGEGQGQERMHGKVLCQTWNSMPRSLLVQEKSQAGIPLVLADGQTSPPLSSILIAWCHLWKMGL